MIPIQCNICFKIRDQENFSLNWVSYGDDDDHDYCPECWEKFRDDIRSEDRKLYNKRKKGRAPK